MSMYRKRRKDAMDEKCFDTACLLHGYSTLFVFALGTHTHATLTSRTLFFLFVLFCFLCVCVCFFVDSRSDSGSSGGGVVCLCVVCVCVSESMSVYVSTVQSLVTCKSLSEFGGMFGRGAVDFCEVYENFSIF
eukprot:Rmarinus@m.834